MKTTVLLYIVAILISLLSTVMAESEGKRFYHENEAEVLFAEFVKEHNRQYKDEEDKQKHFNNFKDNLKKINDLNKQSDAVYGINKFADLSKDEMRTFTGARTN